MTQPLTEPAIRTRLEQALPYPQWRDKIGQMVPWFFAALTPAEHRCPPQWLRDYADESWHPGAKQWVLNAGLLALGQQMQLVRRDLAATRMVALWANPTFELPENLGQDSYETFETSPAFTQAYQLLTAEPYAPVVAPEQVGPTGVFFRAAELLAQDPALLAATRSGYLAAWQSRWVATELPPDQYKWAAVHLAAFERQQAPQLQNRDEQSPAIDFTKTHESPPEAHRGRLLAAGIYQQAGEAWLGRYEQALRWWAGNGESAIQRAVAQARGSFQASLSS